MVGFGPSAVMRGATFRRGLGLVVGPAAGEVLVAALLSLLGEDPQRAKLTDVATIAIAAPLIAVRFIALAPVDRASPPDTCVGAFSTQPRLRCSAGCNLRA